MKKKVQNIVGGGSGNKGFGKTKGAKLNAIRKSGGGGIVGGKRGK